MDAEDAPSKHLSWKQIRTFTKLSPCPLRVTNEMRKANKNGQRRKESQVTSEPVGNSPLQNKPPDARPEITCEHPLRDAKLRITACRGHRRCRPRSARETAHVGRPSPYTAPTGSATAARSQNESARKGGRRCGSRRQICPPP